jgi:hypothetical protein
MDQTIPVLARSPRRISLVLPTPVLLLGPVLTSMICLIPDSSRASLSRCPVPVVVPFPTHDVVRPRPHSFSMPLLGTLAPIVIIVMKAYPAGLISLLAAMRPFLCSQRV